MLFDQSDKKCAGDAPLTAGEKQLHSELSTGITRLPDTPWFKKIESFNHDLGE